MTVRRLAAVAAAVLGLLGHSPPAASSTVAAHPLHTATLTLAPQAGALRGTLRIFAADLGPIGADSVRVARYLSSRVTFRDARGTTPSVHFGAPAREADVLVIPVLVQGIGSFSGLRTCVTILQERFPDQVNVVRVKWTSGDGSLLFLPGDGYKLLP